MRMTDEIKTKFELKISAAGGVAEALNEVGSILGEMSVEDEDEKVQEFHLYVLYVIARAAVALEDPPNGQ